MSDAPSSASAVPAAPKPLRSDGLEARARLLDAALVLFADKGYAKTSTREIAQAAQVNVASISYYFGDKAGLYRAVFNDPNSNPRIEPNDIRRPGQPLEASLSVLLKGFTESLKQGAQMQNCMKLHFRELLEPTGLWEAEIDDNIRPAHMALVEVLCRHLGLAAADDAVHRLAFSITGLAMILHVGTDVVLAIRPALIAGPAAIDTYTDHLVAMALSMVESEGRARAAAQPLSP